MLASSFPLSTRWKQRYFIGLPQKTVLPVVSIWLWAPFRHMQESLSASVVYPFLYTHSSEVSFIKHHRLPSNIYLV